MWPLVSGAFSHINYGGVESGEIFSTIKNITDGDFESWTQDWTAAAVRVGGRCHLNSKMEGLIGTLATRISKSNFRTAVETDMLTRILATVVQLNKNDYDKLRVKSIHDVKATNGSIDILEAVNGTEDGMDN